MVLGMDALEPIPSDMGIDLGGRNVGMAQEHLHSPQVRTVVEQVSGKGMTKAMWRELEVNACRPGIATNQLPEILACDGTAMLSYKDRIGKPSTKNEWPGLL